MLVGNIYKHSITVKKGQTIAVACVQSLDKIQSIHTVGDVSDLGLTEPSLEQQKELHNLLDEFKDIFSKSDQDFGLLANSYHEIDTGSHKPFKSRPYRKSHTEEAIVASEIQKLLDAGLLQPSKSPWASPLLLVKKKNGGHQIVMDYRRLNSLTKKDSYPIP